MSIDSISYKYTTFHENWFSARKSNKQKLEKNRTLRTSILKLVSCYLFLIQVSDNNNNNKNKLQSHYVDVNSV